jgi:hypothetical protein
MIPHVNQAAAQSRNGRPMSYILQVDSLHTRRTYQLLIRASLSLTVTTWHKARGLEKIGKQAEDNNFNLRLLLSISAPVISLRPSIRDHSDAYVAITAAARHLLEVICRFRSIAFAPP